MPNLKRVKAEASVSALLAAMDPQISDELTNRIVAALNTPSQKRANMVVALVTVLLGALDEANVEHQVETVIALMRRILSARLQSGKRVAAAPPK